MTNTARWSDADQTVIEATLDGMVMSVPVDLGNRHYRRIVEGVPANEEMGTDARPPVAIAPYEAAPVTLSDVRAEAERRIIALLDARDKGHMEILISNGTREAVKLLRIAQAQPWTQEQADRAAYLEQVEVAIDAIRDASNVLESMVPIPNDFASDENWPT